VRTVKGSKPTETLAVDVHGAVFAAERFAGLVENEFVAAGDDVTAGGCALIDIDGVVGFGVVAEGGSGADAGELEDGGGAGGVDGDGLAPAAADSEGEGGDGDDEERGLEALIEGIH
jgi:hypothetical protein